METFPASDPPSWTLGHQRSRQQLGLQRRRQRDSPEWMGEEPERLKRLMPE